MNKLFTINNKDINDIDTSILCTSNVSYSEDAIQLLNNNCVVINNINHFELKDIEESILIKFKCTYLKEKKNYSKIDELKINILANISSPNKVFVFLNVLTYLDNEMKTEVINYLKENNKRIINYTTDIEETLLLDYIIVIKEQEIIMEGKKELIFQEEKILKKLGFQLPFIIELSNGLKYYGLVNKTYYNKESLVNDLWK